VVAYARTIHSFAHGVAVLPGCQVLRQAGACPARKKHGAGWRPKIQNFLVSVFFKKPQQRPPGQKIWNPKTAAWGVQMFSVFFSNASINT